MQELIIHLLKSAALISLFYAGYYFLLKNDTSFKTNRIFLLVGILTSVFLPFLKITRKVMVETTATPVFLQDLSNIPVPGALEESAGIDWRQVAGIIYLLGLGFFLLKFLIELFSLLKLIFTHKITQDGKFYIIQKCGNTQPFSFFKFIVLDPAQHTPTEQELILRHERCHARQWHSIDQLLTSLAVYLLWFNPLAWLYRKSVVQNLEYLADKEVIKAQVSKKEYQKTLLKISVGNFQPTLTNQFYQSFIKKRIIMLNKNATQKSNFWKTSFLLPFLLVFIFSFNIKTEAMEISTQKETITSKVEVSAYVTKDSDEETLRSYQRIFKKQGVDLTFDNLQFSDGLLTRVTASFRKKSNGTSGNLTLSNSNGITPLLIYTDGNKVVMDPENAIPKKSEGALQGIGDSPLFIIAGKEYSASQLVDKYVEILGDWSVLKPEEGEEQLGSKAKDGVIVISEGEIIDNYNAHLKEIDRDNKNINREYFWIMQNEPPLFVTLEKKEDEKPTTGEIIPDAEEIIAVQFDHKSTIIDSLQNKPLIIVDGEVQDKDFNLNSIDPETIKSLNVLKEESAVEKYGKRAVNGVIEINLKTDAEILQENEKKQDQKSVTKNILHSKENLSTSYNLSKKSNKKDNEVNIFNVPNKDFSQSNALYVVNGKEMDKDFDPNSISPLNIESVMVLKGPKAIEKYGKKGSEGVIEIITKK
ncbi:M56 family metallopeptidase [Salinimicrobium sp. WS361]|uniref:M56 family metallopeptidase n=1 Tax=Salinimicrobium sp. WS361 TaxID=3425123 RepID=UPI003D6F23B8